MSERKQVDAYFKLLKKQASKHPKQVTISLRQKKKKKKKTACRPILGTALGYGLRR